MSDPKHEPSQDTRSRLMEAALLVFAERGFDGAGIREIAERAKANSAMVQYHFGGKEGLYQESLRYAFEQGHHQIDHLPTTPAPSEADARMRAIENLRLFIRNFLNATIICRGSGECLPEDVERAAMILWGREMQEPRPSMEAFILDSVRPFITYLDAIILALLPDLDAETRYRMGMSIQAQILFIHRDMEMIRLTRGSAYGAEDMDSLTNHLTQFSLRGLGVPEAFPSQGA
jgi:AcrR family transcriptional regulator